MADNFAFCPIEFLGEDSGLFHYRCQQCGGQCTEEDKSDTRRHTIDFECEHCGGPTGGCTDGVPASVAIDPIGVRLVASKACGHAKYALPHGPVGANDKFKPGVNVRVKIIGVASYVVNGKGGKEEIKKARLIELTHKTKGFKVHLGTETTTRETLPRYDLKSASGYCHHIRRGLGPTFHVITAVPEMPKVRRQSRRTTRRKTRK